MNILIISINKFWQWKILEILKTLGEVWEKFGTRLEEPWNKLGISLEDIWEKFGKIYLNSNGKMCYYRKFLHILKNFFATRKNGGNRK